MTNSKQKTDDFYLAISIRVEGRNFKRFAVHAMGVIAALAVLAARVALWLNGKPL